MFKKLLAIIFATLSLAVFAQEPVTIYFPYASGGSTDIFTRRMAERLSNADYKFTVVPTPGAAGLIAVNAVRNNPGSSIAVVGNGLLTFKDININQDIRPVGFIGFEPTVIAVRTDSAYNSLKDLHEATKTKQIFYGSSGVGSYGHYSSSVLANRNRNIVHVPFRSTGPAVPELLAGRLDFLVMDETLIDRFVQAGTLKAIAANYPKRLAKYPNVPTFAEQGVDNQNFYRWEMIVAHPAVDSKLVAHIQQYLKNANIQQELAAMNIVHESVNLNNFIATQQQIMSQIARNFVSE
jgi:tripartite-type tricarboxylate transporter receptor subunit TctC